MKHVKLLKINLKSTIINIISKNSETIFFNDHIQNLIWHIFFIIWNVKSNTAYFTQFKSFCILMHIMYINNNLKQKKNVINACYYNGS